MINYEKYFGTPEKAAENIHTRVEFTRSYVEYVYQKHGKNLNQYDLLALFEDKALILKWLQEEADS